VEAHRTNGVFHQGQLRVDKEVLVAAGGATSNQDALRERSHLLLLLLAQRHIQSELGRALIA